MSSVSNKNVQQGKGRGNANGVTKPPTQTTQPQISAPKPNPTNNVPQGPSSGSGRGRGVEMQSTTIPANKPAQQPVPARGPAPYPSVPITFPRITPHGNPQVPGMPVVIPQPQPQPPLQAQPQVPITQPVIPAPVSAQPTAQQKPVQPQSAPMAHAQPTIPRPNHNPNASPTFHPNIPPRTHSAPPNLQEQERHTNVTYFPEKSGGTLNYTAQPFVPSHHAPMPGLPFMNPPMGIPVNPYAAMQQPPPQPLTSRPKKILTIVDPDTMKEVTPEASATAATTSPSRVQQPAPQTQASPVFYPPYAYIPYNRPGVVPPGGFYPPNPNVNVGTPPFFPDMPTQDKLESKTPPKQEEQRKSSVSSGTQPKPVEEKPKPAPAKQDTAKSPVAISSPQTTSAKPEDKKEPEPTVAEPAVERTEQPAPKPVVETPKPAEEKPKPQEPPKPEPKEEPKPEPVKTEQPKAESKPEQKPKEEPQPDKPSQKQEAKPVAAPTESQKSHVYSREFLLSLQAANFDKPDNLQNIEGIFDDSSKVDRDARLRSSQGRGSFRSTPGRGSDAPLRSSGGAPPTGFGGFRNPNRGGMPGSPSSRKFPGGKKPMRPGAEGPGLTPTPGRWEPQRNSKVSLEQQEQVLREANGILNKITDATFETLSEKVINIGIDTIDILNGIIKLVFDKALTQPKFSPLYAELCRKLSERSPQFEIDGKPQSFKRLLLNRCQEEFETSFSANKKPPRNLDELSPEDRMKAEEEELKDKSRMLGNITFIGELYNIRMLPEKIMHECITKLLGDLKNPSHEDMEALCRLMTTIGSLLDHAKAKDYMDTYFARMKELSRNKSLPSRIRFMLLDVIQLRQSGWVSKKPKESDKEKEKDKGKGPGTVSIQARPGSEKGRPSQPQASSKSNQPSGEQGWETVGKGKRPQDQARSAPPEEVKLRPQAVLSGAKGWNQPKAADDRQRGSSKPETKKETKQEAPKKGNEPPPEELEKKTDLLLKEYLSSTDIKEAIACIKDLNAPSYYPEIVNKAISVGIEKKESDRDAIAKLFAVLFEEGVFTTQHFSKGFASVIEILEDIAIDIPKAPVYIANFLGYGVVDGYVSLASLEQSLEFLVNSGKNTSAARIIAEVFHTIATATSHAKLRELYAESKMDVTKLLKQRSQEGLLKFLEDEKLTGLMPSQTYLKTIDTMISEDKEPAAILSYIENNVPADERIDTSFSKELMKMFVHQVSGHPNLIEQTLMSFSPLLKKVMSSSKQQIAAVYETQAFLHSKPKEKALAESMLHYLYDFGVLRASALKAWADDKSDSTPGKEQLLQVTSKWISSLPPDAEEEEEEEYSENPQHEYEDESFEDYEEDERRGSEEDDQ